MRKFWLGLIVVVLFFGCDKQSESDRKNVDIKPTYTPIVVDKSYSKPVPDVVRPIKVYPFKSGRFAFEVAGPGIKSGTLTIFIDDYGDLETKRSTKTLTDDSIVSIWSVKKGLDIYSIDTQKKEIINAKMDQRKSAAIDMDSLINEHGSLDGANDTLKQQNIVILPNETIGGYDCQVYEMTSNDYVITRWVHQGLELQMAVRKGDGENKITRSLIKAEFDHPVPPECFEYPSTFTLVNY